MNKIRIAQKIANIENTSVRVHDEYTPDLIEMMNSTLSQIDMMIRRGMIEVVDETEFSGYKVKKTPPLQEETTLYVFSKGEKTVGMIGSRPCRDVPNSVQVVSAGVNTQRQNTGIGTTMGAFILQKTQMSGRNLVMEDDITSGSMRLIKKYLDAEFPIEAYDTTAKTFHPVSLDRNGEIICDLPGVFNKVPGAVDMQKQFAPKVPEKVKLVIRAQ